VPTWSATDSFSVSSAFRAAFVAGANSPVPRSLEWPCRRSRGAAASQADPPTEGPGSMCVGDEEEDCPAAAERQEPLSTHPAFRCLRSAPQRELAASAGGRDAP
jgi:hypothetical protein